MPAHYRSKKTRTYRVVVSVGVDDPESSANEKDMESLCNWLFDPLKKTANLLDGGMGRLTVDVQRHD